MFELRAVANQHCAVSILDRPGALQAASIEAADLHEALGDALPGRNELAATLVNEIGAVLEQFQEQGLKPFSREWREADALAASIARVAYGDHVYGGIARGIDEDGALLLETPQQLLRFTSGEVSLRPG